MEIFLVITLVVIAIVIHAAIQSARRLREAKAAYEAALAKLAANPADNALRIAALGAGRYYADLARKAAGSNGRAVFDEVALNNDLVARSGAPAQPVAAAAAKQCPQCAEHVKLEARLCRFCQYKFDAAA